MPFPSSEDLPDPGIEPRSPALEADSLPSEPPRLLRWWERALSARKSVCKVAGDPNFSGSEVYTTWVGGGGFKKIMQNSTLHSKKCKIRCES